MNANPLNSFFCIKFFLLAMLFLSASKMSAGEGFRSVKLRLKWHHQFQSAGYYVAVHKGFYRANNLEVLISEAQDGENSVDAVLAKECEFAIGSSGLVIQRMKGRSVVALAAIFQNSPLILVTQPAEKFKSPNGLVGSRIMVEAGAEEFSVFLNKHKMATKDFVSLKHENAIKAFKNNSIDAFTAYSTDEIFSLEKEGIPYNVLKLNAPDVDCYYSDILFTSQETIDSDPSVVRGFLRASLEGWHYAFENIDETIALIQEKYGVNKSKESLRYEAQEMLKYAITKDSPLGGMKRKRWNSTCKAFADANLAPANVAIDGFIYGETYRSRERNLFVVLGSLSTILFLAFFAFLSDKVTIFLNYLFK